MISNELDPYLPVDTNSGNSEDPYLEEKWYNSLQLQNYSWNRVVHVFDIQLKFVFIAISYRQNLICLQQNI